ncbi:cell division protein YceG involved in septum cleavage [Cytobacillus eiseniae]|uniref:Cell division protein YceG involved in septum cleavage n=1 Tax=Cytobacillus eiseniae TaxID=762947 RepID=A0ABS4RK01_9BACI|nr:hypothetical protein [Cytobacillus eiseniae]MBP2242685.1 cell division protein YceG involved in septum cleavage [Cytobacillus eiseniae]
MKPETMRSFAAGLLVAASMCAAVYFLDSEKETNTKVVQQLTEDEMKTALTDKGYVIHTEEEWNNQLAATQTDEQKKPKEEEGTIVYRTMLTVSLGMTSIDVGKALEKAQIIDSAKDFFNEVEKRGVSTKLRPGTYDVESGMTTDEIIAAIFK